MNWTESYQQRIVTPEDALNAVQSGQRLYIGGGCGVPQSLLDALVARAPELHDVETISILTMGRAPLRREAHGRAPAPQRAVSSATTCARRSTKGEPTSPPSSCMRFPSLFRDGTLPLDVCLIQVGPPDEHGFCSMGVEVGVTKPAAQAARIVIAEVNERMPRVLGTASSTWASSTTLFPSRAR